MKKIIFAYLLTTIFSLYATDHRRLAHEYFTSGNVDTALYHYKQALAQSPDDWHIAMNIGDIHTAQKRHERALEYYARAVECTINDMNNKLTLGNKLLNLGNHFFGCRKPHHALKAFRCALKLSDRFSAVHHNIGFTLAEQLGDHTAALKHYAYALNLKPNDAEAHFCAAMSRLALGQLHTGFDEYTWRWQRGSRAPRQWTYPLDKQWHGESVTDKRILIRVEQGLGDTLHFIRYAQFLHKAGACVLVETQRPLVQLLERCEYLDEIIAIGSPLPAFDYQIPMLDLPHVFETTNKTIPANVPYLRADKKLTQQWRERLPQDSSFKIGICWHGDAAHGHSKFMPLEYIARLAHLENVRLYCLQKFNGLDQLDAVSEKTMIVQFDELDTDNGPFMDTAALMKNLDLVITADTSIAHLAGGLGVPTWVVLPFPAEWRWQHGTTTPWYPTMKLFRQKTYNQWDDVLEDIVDALVPLVAQR